MVPHVHRNAPGKSNSIAAILFEQKRFHLVIDLEVRVTGWMDSNASLQDGVAEDNCSIVQLFNFSIVGHA